MKPKFLMAALIFLCSFASYGQRPNGEMGYVIKLNGDTLRSSISTTGVGRQKKVVYYEKGQKMAGSNGSPGVIAGFGRANGQRYQSAKVGFLNSHTEKYDSAPAFLEILLDGPLRLLFLKDEGQSRYWVADNRKGTISELVLKVNTVYQNGRATQVTLRQYTGILKIVVADRPDFVGKADIVPFTSKSLVDFIDEYNKAVDPGHAVVSERLRRKAEANWSGQISMALSRLQYSHDRALPPILDPEAGMSVGVLVGLDYLPAGIGKYFGFSAGAGLLRRTHKSSIRSGQLAFNHLEMYAQPKGYFYLGKIRANIGVGAAVTFLLNKTNIGTVRDNKDKDVSFLTYNRLSMPLFNPGLIVSMGAEIPVSDRMFLVGGPFFERLSLSPEQMGHAFINSLFGVRIGAGFR